MKLYLTARSSERELLERCVELLTRYGFEVEASSSGDDLGPALYEAMRTMPVCDVLVSLTPPGDQR